MESIVFFSCHFLVNFNESTQSQLLLFLGPDNYWLMCQPVEERVLEA